jgi:outer membrane protein OmpA-like peptidoglycan-associated protein
MKRPWIVAFAVACLAGLLAVDYAGYRSSQSIQARLARLERQLDEVTRLASQESAAARAASQRAEEAAAHARTAAGAREQAEQLKAEAERQKQQAVEGRDDAVMAAAHASAQVRDAEQKITDMRQERQEELNRMQEALSHVVETRRTPTGMLIVLPESTFRFDFDKADLTAKNRELLARIAGILLVSKGYSLSVFGYTDDVGSDEYNQQLSLRRAKAVQDYLVQSGIASSIIGVKGYGKSSPFEKGATAAARARNRRVEIAVTDSSIRYGG